MNHELVLVDQVHLRQRKRNLHARQKQPLTSFPLQLAHGYAKISRRSSAFQSTLSRVLDATYFFALSIERAKGSIQSGLTLFSDGRHAASIISYVTRPRISASACVICSAH